MYSRIPIWPLLPRNEGGGKSKHCITGNFGAQTCMGPKPGVVSTTFRKLLSGWQSLEGLARRDIR